MEKKFLGEGLSTGTKYYSGDYFYPSDIKIVVEDGVRKAYPQYKVDNASK